MATLEENSALLCATGRHPNCWSVAQKTGGSCLYAQVVHKRLVQQPPAEEQPACLQFWARRYREGEMRPLTEEVSLDATSNAVCNYRCKSTIAPTDTTLCKTRLPLYKGWIVLYEPVAE